MSLPMNNKPADQELEDAVAEAPIRWCVCIHQVAAPFCVKLHNGRHPAVLKFWRYAQHTWYIHTYMISNRNSDSVNQCLFILFAEPSYQISSQCNLKQRSLRLVWTRLPNIKNKMSTDKRSKKWSKKLYSVFLGFALCCYCLTWQYMWRVGHQCWMACGR